VSTSLKVDAPHQPVSRVNDYPQEFRVAVVANERLKDRTKGTILVQGVSYIGWVDIPHILDDWREYTSFDTLMDTVS
jgi:hypothetical protein